MEPIITFKEIEILRVEVKYSYRLSAKEDLLLTNTKGNEYFDELGKSIRNELEKGRFVPKEETLRKFFYDDAYYKHITPNTIKAFRDFVKTCRIKYPPEEISIEQKPNNFPGTNLIDEKFQNEILKINHPFTKADFYLGKQDESCQWYGIIRHNWDIEREKYHDMKTDVFRSFNIRFANRISAFIQGTRGSGKSTVLRRLALDCVNTDITVLWVSNFTVFNSYGIEKLKDDINNKYLIIVDGWDNIIPEKSGNKFLNYITNLPHVRIVISDIDSQNKPYLEFLDPSQIYYLSPDENQFVAGQTITPSYNDFVLSELTDIPARMYNTPLYIILFVTYSDHRVNKSQNVFAPNYFLSQFKTIIRNDLTTLLFSEYNGLAKAIYYWACLYKEYAIQISWEVFLIWADFYNDKKGKIVRIKRLDKKHPICNILLQYIYLERFVHPMLTDYHILHCHHDLIINDGFTQSLTSDYYFNDDIKFEIVRILMDRIGPNTTSMELYEVFKLRKSNSLNRTQKKYFASLIFEYPTEYSVIALNSLAIEFYDAADKITDENSWKIFLHHLLSFLYCYKYTQLFVNKFLKTIIKNGCKSPTMIEAYKRSKSINRFLSLEEEYVMRFEA